MSSIAEEIQRLKDAKSNIKTSIQNKGVSVDDTATLDAYPALIDSIEQTGGGFKIAETGVKLAYSSFSEVPDGLDFDGVTDMGNMFYYCELLQTIPQLDTSQVTNMSHMFNGCHYLQSIPMLDTSQVTNMSSMFNFCNRLQTIPQLDTSQVNSMSYMFIHCSNLQSVPQLDTSQVNSSPINMFSSCSNLTDLGGFVGLKVNLDLSSCPLTHDSIMNVINKAADVTELPQTITLGPTNLAKLTDEQKSIATNKGWTLA